jgi:hypothetical protein
MAARPCYETEDGDSGLACDTSAGPTVVGEACDGHEAVAAIRRLMPR